MSNDDTNNFFISMISLLDENIYINDSLKYNKNVISIRDNIRKFLIENCQHDLVTDYIDIDPEQSQQIIYCTKCNMNL